MADKQLQPGLRHLADTTSRRSQQMSLVLPFTVDCNHTSRCDFGASLAASFGLSKFSGENSSIPSFFTHLTILQLLNQAPLELNRKEGGSQKFFRASKRRSFSPVAAAISSPVQQQAPPLLLIIHRPLFSFHYFIFSLSFLTSLCIKLGRDVALVAGNFLSKGHTQPSSAPPLFLFIGLSKPLRVPKHQSLSAICTLYQLEEREWSEKHAAHLSTFTSVRDGSGMSSFRYQITWPTPLPFVLCFYPFLGISC